VFAARKTAGFACQPALDEDIDMSISIRLDSKILEPGTTYALRVDKLARDTVAVSVRSEAFTKHKWRPLKTAPGSSAEGSMPIAKGAHGGAYQLLVKELNEDGACTISIQTLDVAGSEAPPLQPTSEAVRERIRATLAAHAWDESFDEVAGVAHTPYFHGHGISG
jgi:hypothetical protein